MSLASNQPNNYSHSLRTIRELNPWMQYDVVLTTFHDTSECNLLLLWFVSHGIRLVRGLMADMCAPSWPLMVNLGGMWCCCGMKYAVTDTCLYSWPFTNLDVIFVLLWFAYTLSGVWELSWLTSSSEQSLCLQLSLCNEYTGKHIACR